MRLFAAVEIPGDVRGSLAGAAERLLPDVAGLRLSDPATWHLTLRFLGERPPAEVARISDSLARAADRCTMGVVRLRGFGAFPSWKRAEVVWAGIEDGDGALAALAGSVDAELRAAGFGEPDRPFRAHVTVGRVRSAGPHRRNRRGPDAPGAGSDPTRGAGGDVPPRPTPRVEPPDVAFPVSEVVLFESRLRRGGAEHAALARFPLRR